MGGFVGEERYVPLGMGAWFGKQGVSNTVEMDWWDEVQHSCGDRSLTVAFTPAQVGRVPSKTLTGFKGWGPE